MPVPNQTGLHLPEEVKGSAVLPMVRSLNLQHLQHWGPPALLSQEGQTSA